jgi:hypothetical protein
VHSHADLKARRTAPYPAFIAAGIDALIAQHHLLEWETPVIGGMRA